jgi:transcriptional regulator with XRE-family HTH domain
MALQSKDPKEKVAWRSSYAKELLRQDILNNIVALEDDDTDPVAIFYMRPEFAKFGLKTFGNRLKELRKQIKKDQGRSESDLGAYQDFMMRHKPATHTFYGYQQWENSEGQELLRKDMDDKLHEAGIGKTFATKEDFYMSRAEYRQYPMNVFIQHIHQEVALRKHLFTEKQRRRKKSGRKYEDI